MNKIHLLYKFWLLIYIRELYYMVINIRIISISQYLLTLKKNMQIYL